MQSFCRLRAEQGCWVSAWAASSAGEMLKHPQSPFTTSPSDTCQGSFPLLLPLEIYLQSQSLLIIKKCLISSLSVPGARGCTSALEPELWSVLPPVLSDIPWHLLLFPTIPSWLSILTFLCLDFTKMDNPSSQVFYLLGPGFLSWRHISMSWIFEEESIPVFQCKILQANLLKCNTVCWMSPWALKFNRIEEKQ